MKFFKQALSFLLAVIMIFGISATAIAADSQSGEIKLMSYNVDGLPIPASLSSTGRDPKLCTEQMSNYINDYAPDILAVQEDFNYHRTLTNGLDFDYQTITSGVIPFGDGLNFFSSYPIYNTQRFAWKDAHGIFDGGSDELTPKGILYSVFEIADGVYIDVYNIHTDGYEDEESVKARINQYHQLIDTINTISADRPVIIIGDTNARFCREYTQLRKLFIDEQGFKDAWDEICEGGKYTVWNSEEEANRVNGHAWWGIYDSVDRVMFRDGGGISFEALTHEFKDFGGEPEHIYADAPLSDHSATIVTLKYTVDEIQNDEREYKVEHFNIFKRIFNNVIYFGKTLYLILSQLPKLISGEIKIDIK